MRRDLQGKYPQGDTATGHTLLAVSGVSLGNRSLYSGRTRGAGGRHSPASTRAITCQLAYQHAKPTCGWLTSFDTSRCTRGPARAWPDSHGGSADSQLTQYRGEDVACAVRKGAVLSDLQRIQLYDRVGLVEAVPLAAQERLRDLAREACLHVCNTSHFLHTPVSRQ